MQLDSLALHSFKNYEILELDTKAEIVCLVGANGSGKTNLLDAIYYLSMTKSAFNSVDTQSIRHGDDFFSIRGDWKNEEADFRLICGLRNGEKKLLTVNQQPYEKITEHIGRFPVVLIAPDDTDLIREGSEDRRKFFDAIIAQIDAEYLQNLIQYNHVLKLRNAMLKQMAESNRMDADWLSIYDQKLIVYGEAIYERRKRFIEQFKPVFQEKYQIIADQKEQTDIVYQSDLSKGRFELLLGQHIKRDVQLQRTSVGIHKDDFEFLIENLPIKKFGSQGQKKSFAIALKLSQFQQIELNKGFKPILLLDDIFDKLDDQRITRLMEMVSGNAFGQLFLTDARPERTLGLFKEIKAHPLTYLVDNGSLQSIPA